MEHENSPARKYCVVPQCGNVKRKDISLHLFPSDKKMRKKWLDALKMKMCNSTMKICSDHFTPTDFHYKGEYSQKTRLKSCAVPSEKIPVTLLTKLKRNKEQDELRSKRVSKRRKLSEEKFIVLVIENDTKDENMNLEISNPATIATDPSENLDLSALDPKTDPSINVSNGTTIPKTKSSVVEFCDKATQLVIPQVEKSCQAEEMLFEKKKKAIDAMIKSDKHLNTLTGITSLQMLEAIEASVIKLESTVPKKYYCSLSARHRIMMTFMMLKMNLNYASLAVFFETTIPTVKLTVSKMLMKLKEVFQSGIKFPNKEEILQNFPLRFDAEGEPESMQENASTET